jgi:hypothetical protein
MEDCRKVRLFWLESHGSDPARTSANARPVTVDCRSREKRYTGSNYSQVSSDLFSDPPIEDKNLMRLIASSSKIFEQSSDLSSKALAAQYHCWAKRLRKFTSPTTPPHVAPTAWKHEKTSDLFCIIQSIERQTRTRCAIHPSKALKIGADNPKEINAFT